VRQPLIDRRLSPGQVDRAFGTRPAHGLGELDQPVGGVLPPVEQHVLD
jgi:hypothetical protein